MKNMKRLLQAAALGFAITSYAPAHAGGVLKLGFDSASEIEFKSNTSPSSTVTFDVDSGFNLAFELHGAWDNVDFGVGVEFQNWRNLTNHPAGDSYIQFIQVYLTMRLRPKVETNFVPYLAFQGGMAIFRGDDNITGNGTVDTAAGAHFAVGFGAIMAKSIMLEMMVSRDTGSLERNGSTVSDVSYSKVSFSFGVYF
jgi:hypothetical protein